MSGGRRPRRWTAVGLAGAWLAAAACAGGGAPEPAAKIRFDLAAFDDDGLTGPADGKRAGAYEFCIPARAETEAEVRAIDPTLTVSPRSRGRVGCAVPAEALCIGSTHQAGFRDVLHRLAALPYVARIEPFVGE